MKTAALLLAAAAVWGRFLAEAAAAAPTALERAMEAELGRSMAELKAEGYPAPYFLSLTATEIDSWEERCPLGAAAFSARYRQRLMTPDLRVGSHELDNHPVASGGGFIGRSVSVEEDDLSLRHALWRMLDAAYKGASADFLRKQALRVSRGKTEYDTDDLSREEPRRRPASQSLPPWTAEGLSRLCLAASGEFRRAPGLLHAEAGARSRRVWSRLMDSEGSRVDFGWDAAEIELEAVDLSTDGMRLFVSRRYVATSSSALPSPEVLRAAARELLGDLEALKSARSTSPFSAPALLDPSVSAAVVLAIGLRLSGEEQRNPSGAQTFRDKMGKKVLPEGFTIEDDPLRGSFGGLALAGHYEFDEQGVPPSRVTLIEKGMLKGHLLSRYPVIGFSRSNGHGRGLPGYRPEGVPGNLFLRAERSWPAGELLSELRRECRRRGKPYGLWIKKLRHFTQQQGTGGHAAIRLMPTLVYLVEARTGGLTLVRDLDLVGTPLVLMNNILRAGDDAKAHNLVAGVPLSVVTPSLLLSEAELQRSETKPEKSPILPPPPASEPPPESGGVRPRRPVPTIPTVPHVQVQRYTLRGARGPFQRFIMQGLEDLRLHAEGEDYIIDAKLQGHSLSALGDTVRRMDAAVFRLAPGAKVEVRVLAPTMTRTSYEALYGQGWPE